MAKLSAIVYIISVVFIYQSIFYNSWISSSYRPPECYALQPPLLPHAEASVPDIVVTTYSHHAALLLQRSLDSIRQPSIPRSNHRSLSHQKIASSDQALVNYVEQQQVKSDIPATHADVHFDRLANSFAATLMEQGQKLQGQIIQDQNIMQDQNIRKPAQDQGSTAEIRSLGKVIASTTTDVGIEGQSAAVSDLNLSKSRSRYSEVAKLLLSSATQAEQQHANHQAQLKQVGKIALESGFGHELKVAPKSGKESLALKLGTAIRDVNLKQEIQQLNLQGQVYYSSAVGNIPRLHQQHQSRGGSWNSYSRNLGKAMMGSAFQQQATHMPPGSQIQDRVVVHLPWAYWIVWLGYLVGVVAFAGVLGWLLISIFKWASCSMAAGVGLVVIFEVALELGIHSYESTQFRYSILPFRILLLFLVIFSTTILKNPAASLASKSLAYSSKFCLANPAYLLLTFRTLATQACIWATCLTTLALAAVTFLPAAATAGCHADLPREVIVASIALVCTTVQLCGLVHARFVAKVSSVIQGNVESGESVCATALERESSSACQSSVSLLVWISAFMVAIQCASVLHYRTSVGLFLCTLSFGLFLCTLAGACLVCTFIMFGISNPVKPQNLKQAIASFNAVFVGARGKMVLLVSYCLSLLSQTAFACLLYIPCGIATLLASQQLLHAVSVDSVSREETWEVVGHTWQAWAIGASVACLWMAGFFVYAAMVVSVKWATYVHMVVQQRQVNAEEACTKLLEKGEKLSNDWK